MSAVTVADCREEFENIKRDLKRVPPEEVAALGDRVAALEDLINTTEQRLGIAR